VGRTFHRTYFTGIKPTPLTVYLTFNDYASGVYASQVADVVKFLNERAGERVQLVAFVSLRNYFSSRRDIRVLSPGAKVLPMFPGIGKWRLNIFLLRLVLFFMKPKTTMARGIFATHLALKWRKKGRQVVFDARGAYYPEFNEYKLTSDQAFIQSISTLEKQAVEQADKCLAVSHALIDYWKTFYGVDASAKTKVIPCTISFTESSVKKQPLDVRAELGFAHDDIVLVYSGSTAGWQSFSFLFNLLETQLRTNPHIKLLFLAKINTFENTPLAPYTNRIVTRWLSPAEIDVYLQACDYGLLVREKSVTNQVASPTKFAEYLSAGCKVIISPGIGDFSAFVQEHDCGFVLNNKQLDLTPVTPEQKKHHHHLAQQYFTKEAHLQAYQYLLT